MDESLAVRLTKNLSKTDGDFCIFWKLSYSLVRDIMVQNKRIIYEKRGLLSQKIMIYDNFVTAGWYDEYMEKSQVLGTFFSTNTHIVMLTEDKAVYEERKDFCSADQRYAGQHMAGKRTLGGRGQERKLPQCT